MTTHPVMDFDLVKSVYDLTDSARRFVLADVTVWLAEHGAVTAGDMRRFIDEAKAIA
jgi:hypothetical protein